MLTTMVILLVMGTIKGVDFSFFRLIFILAGIGSIIDGVESYFQGENKKVYFVNFGFAILWLMLTLQFWD